MFKLTAKLVTSYYKDKQCTILHREDGPAIEWYNGRKEWYLNGDLHREDGPAIELANGKKYWFLNGKQYSNIESIDQWQKIIKTLLLI